METKKNDSQNERRNYLSADRNRINGDHLDTQNVSGNIGDENEDFDDEELTEADFAIDDDEGDEEEDDLDIL